MIILGTLGLTHKAAYNKIYHTVVFCYFDFFIV